MDIIVAYRVGPCYIRLLQRYWGGLNMVAKSRGYFGAPFKFQGRMNQGSLLSHTIFNMMVDTFLPHWVTMVAATE